MKLRQLIFAALLTSLTPTSFADQASEALLKNHSVNQAILNTQLLEVEICHEKANLNPKTIETTSTAFMFFNALQNVSDSANIIDRGDMWFEKLKLMSCDKDGVLQLDMSATH